MKIFDKLTDTIGSTPLVDISRYSKSLDLKARLLVKLEYFNPAGSVKDRVALSMVEDAESRGLLSAGGTIIEPTSGNTGIGLAMVAASKGYKLILTMPDTMSVERRRILAALGTQIVLTEGAKGMKGAISKSEELVEEIPGAIILSQFDNSANPEIHTKTTAQEVWRDTDGTVDYFVAGVGTGGTVSGVGRGLKAYNPEIKVIAVEPSDSPVLSGGGAGPHKIQGIGAGFVPENYDASVVDGVIGIDTDSAYSAVRELAKREGILVGISSGAALSAATQLAKQDDMAGKCIVVLLPDSGERYLSTELFESAM